MDVNSRSPVSTPRIQVVSGSVDFVNDGTFNSCDGAVAAELTAAAAAADHIALQKTQRHKVIAARECPSDDTQADENN